MVSPSPGLGLYLALLALTAGERGVELALSVRNARRAFRSGAREVGRGHTQVMMGVHALFLPCCALEVLLLERPLLLWLAAPALAGVLFAQGLRYWAVATLGERWNVRVIAWPGLAPVASGPYRFLRHPNYLAVAIELACLPLVHGAWVAALGFSLANAALLTVRIRTEERALGDEYARVFAGRPRLLPGAPHGR